MRNHQKKMAIVLNCTITYEEHVHGPWLFFRPRVVEEMMNSRRLPRGKYVSNLDQVEDWDDFDSGERGSLERWYLSY